MKLRKSVCGLVLWAACALLLGAGVAQAQVTYQPGSTPTFVINTGRAEVLGSVRLTAITAGPSVASTIQVLYQGVACDNTPGVPPAPGSVVAAPATAATLAATGMTIFVSGAYTTANVAFSATVPVANTSAGCVVSIVVSAGIVPTPAPTDFIELGGVRGRIGFLGGITNVGQPVFASVNAAPGNSSLFTAPTSLVVGTTQVGLQVLGVTPGAAVSCFTVFTNPIIAIQEAFNGAFVQQVVGSGFAAVPANARPLFGGTNNTQVRFVVSGLPTGVTLTWPSTVPANAMAAFVAGTVGAGSRLVRLTTSTATSQTYEYQCGDQALCDVTQESFTIVPVITENIATLVPGTATIQVRLFPDLITGDATVLTDGPFVDFAAGVPRPRFNDPLRPSPAPSFVAAVFCNPVPTLNSLSPSIANVGGPAFTLTVNGSNFVSSSVVQWNGLARTTTFGSSTQLQALIPAGDIASPGTTGALVTVFNPAPAGGTSNSLAFTIAPGFTLSISPSSQSVTQGGTATYTVSVVAGTGFSSPVTLACIGLPAGAACSFSPNPAPPGTSTLTAITTGSTPIGSVNFTVVGNSGASSASASATLNVTATPDFRLAISPASQTAVGGSAEYTVTINAIGGFNSPVSLSCSGLPAGAGCGFSPNPAPPGTASLTVGLPDSSGGTVTLTVTGTSGTLTRTASAQLTIPATPSFSLSLSPESRSVTPGGTVTYTVNITGQGGFTDAVLLSCSGLPTGAALPTGVACSFSPNPAVPGSSVLTVSTTGSTPAGTAGITVSGTSGSLTRTALAALSVAAADFSLSVAPSSQSINRGATATYTVTIAARGSFSGVVSLSCSDLPAGATCSFSPSSTTPGTSTLVVSTTANTPLGALSFTIRGVSGSLSRTASAALTVGRGPVFTEASITNAASFVAGATAGSIVTIFGTGLTTNVTGIVLASAVPLPRELRGTSVTVNGIAAPLYGIANVDGREQINLQVPYEVVGSSTAAVVVNNNGAISSPVQVNLLPAQPGVFTIDGTAGAIVHGNGRLVASASPADRNEVVLVFAAGLGPVVPTPETGAVARASPLSRAATLPIVTIGGLNARVDFAGLAPFFVALYQLNVAVPATAPSGNLDLVVQTGGQASPPVKIAVR